MTVCVPSGLHAVPTHVERRCQPDYAGSIAARTWIERREPVAGALGRNSGQRSIRRMGLLDTPLTGRDRKGRVVARGRNQRLRGSRHERSDQPVLPACRTSASHRQRYEGGNKNTHMLTGGLSQLWGRFGVSGNVRAFTTDGYYVVARRIARSRYSGRSTVRVGSRARRLLRREGPAVS